MPALSAIVSLALMLSLPGATWLRLFAWMGVGVAIYFLYGYRRSRQGLDLAAGQPHPSG